MRWKDVIKIKSPCDTCSGGCQNWRGCARWQKWFINYWNTYIHRDMSEPEESETKKVWHYEHPDYVREGIKWEG